MLSFLAALALAAFPDQGSEAPRGDLGFERVELRLACSDVIGLEKRANAGFTLLYTLVARSAMLGRLKVEDGG